MYKYATQDYKKESMARAVGIALQISAKQSVEICNMLRNKNLGKAKNILKDVIEEKKAVPFRRYLHNVAHKKETGPGRYPKKASEGILKMLESAEANAQFKGLNTSNLVISHICSHKAATQWHSGRKRGRKMKRTHIEVVLRESANVKADEKKEKGKDKK